MAKDKPDTVEIQKEESFVKYFRICESLYLYNIVRLILLSASARRRKLR